MNDKSKLPSKLLSLPSELWHHIMSSTRYDEDAYDRLETRLRYQSLQNTSLAHRILQPFAQEELLSVLDIKRDESLSMLLEVLRGSDRLASYAKRTEKIGLSVGNTMEDGLLKRLSEFCTNIHQMRLNFCDIDLCEITCFTTLRRLQVWECEIDAQGQLQSLPYLKMMEIHRVEWLTLNADAMDSDHLRSFFSPAHLPALGHLDLGEYALDQHGTLYHPLLPQLTHITYNPSDATDFDKISSQFQLSTALKSLRMSLSCCSPGDFSPAFIKSFKALNVEEIHLESADNNIDWIREINFSGLYVIVGLPEDVKTLKKFSLSMNGVSVSRNWEIAEEWIEFKQHVRKICAKNKIQIVRFDGEWESEDDLAWID